MNRRGWVAILFSVFILPLSGCGGGTSGSTPDPNSPSFFGKSLTIRAQMLGTDGNPMVNEPVELEESGQVKETDEEGIANFSLVLGSKEEIVLLAAGQNISVDPSTLPDKTSLVALVVNVAEDGIESIIQNEVRLDPVSDCSKVLRRKDTLDFEVTARDAKDGEGSVQCGMILRQTSKGEPDKSVQGWMVSVDCQADGTRQDLDEVKTDDEGTAQLNFELDLTKKGCRYIIYPELDIFNPDAESGGFAFNTTIFVR